MKFKIEIECNNAAFGDLPGFEVARLLRGVADEVDERDILPGETGPLRDYNGNRVGFYRAAG